MTIERLIKSKPLAGSNKIAITLTACAALSMAAVSLPDASAAPSIHVGRPYEWTLQIQTEKLPAQFQYNGSNLKEIVKARMHYYSMEDQEQKVLYEDLWYSKSKSLGMERHHKLEMKKGDAIAIRVLHKNPSASEDEQKAAGKAVMKAIMDANINRNMVATIKVPISSFSEISAEIQNYNFSLAPTGMGETPIASDLNLFLESEPAGLTQSFVHYH